MSDPAPSAGELLRTGQLAAAIEAANTAVRSSPADFAKRLLLAELLVFGGNIQRADVILDAAAQLDPTTAVVVAQFRQLLRAENARRQCLTEGRVPEFLGEPTAALVAELAARVALRAGDAAEAASKAAEAENVRPRVAGTFDTPSGSQEFSDFRDADDLYAGFFEVLTSTGKYFWIPTERIASVEFHPPRRLSDLAWRPAAMSVINGPDGEVYLPALYVSTEPSPSEELSLGRTTEWLGEEDGLVRGVGQRMFLVGDDAYGITDLTVVRFAA